MGFFLFLYNVVIGFFSVLKRVLLSLVVGSFLIARLDYVLLMRGFENLDSGQYNMNKYFSKVTDNASKSLRDSLNRFTDE